MGKFTRRDLLSAGAGLLAAGRVPRHRSAEGNESRPNILWLVSEDNSASYIGAYGNPLVHTPNIDGLARRGLRFRHAYSNAPVCAVSRFGILTGVYSESCGPAHHHRTASVHPPALKGYPEYLRRAGYYCTNNAKTDYNSDIDR